MPPSILALVVLGALSSLGGFAPRLAHAQDAGGTEIVQTMSAEPVAPIVDTNEPSVSSQDGDTTQPEAPSLVPGIADERLAEVDDGIDEIFSAWVSERLFTGPTPAGSSLMVLTELGVRFGITRDARARADWGFAYSSSHVVGSFTDAGMMRPYDTHVERVEARNPVLQLEWAPVIDSTRFSFGLGVAVPTAAGENAATNVTQAPISAATNTTHELMLATAGGLGPWRYRRERMAVFIPLSFTFPIDRMTIAIEGAAAISAPVIGAGPVPVTGDLQADVQLSGDLLPELRLGARFGISVLDIGAPAAPATATAPPMPGTIVQPSATGYVRMRIDPGFLIASVLADVGGYYGLGASGGVWSVTLGGGVAIP